MGLSSFKPAKKPYPITDCTCGRKRKGDYTDLAVIIEEDGKAYVGYGTLVSVMKEASLVVCTREGCLGKWRSANKYVAKLPRLFMAEYNKMKK